MSEISLDSAKGIARAAEILSRRPTVPPWALSFGVALFLVAFQNVSFWRRAAAALGAPSLRTAAVLASLFVVLLALFNAVLSPFGFRRILKPALIAFLVVGAASAYFSDAYGVVIDATMIQNVVETRPGEVRELLNPRFFLYLLALGALPSLAVLRARVRWGSFRREALLSAGVATISLVTIASIALLESRSFVTLFGEDHTLRHLVNPASTIHSAALHAARVVSTPETGVRPVGLDAHRKTGYGVAGRRTILVLVVGETARASSFSLDGYPRDTNPRLREAKVLYYPNVTACGTSTAISIPCMFSAAGERAFDGSEARHTEGLLDVLSHAGIRVLWRDNNTGCKGTCDRVENESLVGVTVPGLCAPGSDWCYDEILLRNLEEWIDRDDRDAVVVLHQIGSHGPAYSKRYPPEFGAFEPTCRTNHLQDCGREEVVNAYDNSILYTDHFLGEVVEFLEARGGRADTAMIYVSDHGESLGERNVYLHGMPRALAGDEQLRVPLVLWLSPGLRRREGLDRACLDRGREAPLSHDNLFHSVLGLMGVETGIYDADLDLFARCSDGRGPSVARLDDPR